MVIPMKLITFSIQVRNLDDALFLGGALEIEIVLIQKFV